MKKINEKLKKINGKFNTASLPVEMAVYVLIMVVFSVKLLIHEFKIKVKNKNYTTVD